MTLDTPQPASADPAIALMMVRVDFNGHGAWEVTLADQREPIRCQTLDEARRAAYRCAARRRPCELVMCDAYHRVLHRELIER